MYEVTEEHMDIWGIWTKDGVLKIMPSTARGSVSETFWGDSPLVRKKISMASLCKECILDR